MIFDQAYSDDGDDKDGCDCDDGDIVLYWISAGFVLILKN